MSINLNAIDILGKTAFHLACGEGHSNVVKIFMEISATLSIDLNAKDIIGQTAFHSACASGHFNVVKTFIENSANLSCSGSLSLIWVRFEFLTCSPGYVILF